MNRDPERVQRFGQVIKIRPEFREEYIKYHAEVWPEVLDQIKRSNIRNYSIFLKDDFLFAYFEYTGDDFRVDMEKMAQDEHTQKWWEIMEPMQEPLASTRKGEWWADMREVFHLE